MCPGTTEYLIGSPLFDRATIKLPTGKQFVVTASRNGPQRPYIRGATLNGQPFHKTYLTHEQIANGGEVIFNMTSAPDKWASAPEARPASAMELLKQALSGGSATDGGSRRGAGRGALHRAISPAGGTPA